VEGTPYERFVSQPIPGSIHAYGMALDLTLTIYGEPVDMGSAFDSFDDCAGKENENWCVKEGRLTPTQRQNREMLREAMRAGGWVNLPSEWWHFNAGHSSEKIRDDYRRID
jgi:D-alanyl-D-alanine dipeptidase